LTLCRGDLRIFPIEVSGIVGYAVAPVACVENDESKAGQIERVVAAFLPHLLEKLSLRERLNTVVPQDGMHFETGCRERADGPLQPIPLRVEIFRGVDQIAQLHEESEIGSAKLLDA